ncbi:hypothetical protein D3C72_1311310 [compost metagenome]
MEDLAIGVEEERACARPFLDVSVGLGQGSAQVEVEVAALGREPIEAPAHALFERGQLGIRRARHRDHGNVMVAQMHQGALQVVGQERTTHAAFLPVGTEHEVIEDELALALEQVGQAVRAAGVQELVGLVHLDPGQGQALARQRVLGMGQRFFAAQQGLARGVPLVAGYDGVIGLHRTTPWRGGPGGPDRARTAEIQARPAR